MGVKNMAEKEIGEIFSYYSKVGVAAIKLTGVLRRGDKVHIKGHTTDFEQEIIGMQIEHKNIEKAKRGDDLGIKVNDRVRPGDKVYKV